MTPDGALPEVRAFADLEALLVVHLETAVSGARAVTKLPSNLVEELPLVRVISVGGRDIGVTDRVRLDVEAFAADRPAASDLAEQCRTELHGLRHTALSGWLIDRVVTESRPTWVDYQNENVQRYVATYTVETRAHV